MKPADKDYEMARFSKGETKILVATTVIEVGVNVPNATLMVIENANRFGLAQLHQLRGRVGRGSEQSYCILMTDNKLGADSRHRIEVMVQTNNGFEIADADLKLRGPGELAGTQQSGVLELKLADLAQDAQLLQIARDKARSIIEEDPNLSLPKHNTLHTHLNEILKHKGSQWAQIS
jgi:ATP-dependent DNA helicase RecG